jgi:hypothetical protein
LRALRDCGAHENANRSSADIHTPHAGIAWGRALLDAVTIQKLREEDKRVSAHDHGNAPSRSSGTP